MIRYGRTLDRAGIRDRPARRGYRAIARTLRRADPAHYVAVRLLIPPSLQPHLLAVYWFAHATDGLADSGPYIGRRERFDEWAAAARRALDSGDGGKAASGVEAAVEITDLTAVNGFAHQVQEGSDGGVDPRLAVFALTAAECGIPAGTIDTFLTGMRGDVDRTGLSSEAQFSQYVEDVSLPYMLLLVSVHPGCRDPRFVEAFRLLAAGAQRVDSLADLAEDIRAVRAGLPGAVLAEQIARARADLDSAGHLLHAIPRELQPMTNVLLALHRLHLDAIERAGDKVLRRRVGHPVLASLRTLMDGRKEARHA